MVMVASLKELKMLPMMIFLMVMTILSMISASLGYVAVGYCYDISEAAAGAK